MASPSSYLRAAARSSSLFSLRSRLLNPKASSASLRHPASSSAAPRRHALSRSAASVEAARCCSCCSSLLPLHSAMATARMTSRLSSTSSTSRALSQGT